jgi:hypothetical protein
MRNGKSRKEFYFTPEERQLITITARRFHIDESSMVRVLIQLGYEALPGAPAPPQPTPPNSQP